MARFVSRYANYSLGIRDEIPADFSRNQTFKRGLEAQFDRRGLTDYDKETAAKQLSFHGLPEDKDTGREVSPYSRLALFDSEVAKKHLRWTDEEHDEVVEGLRESDRYGLDFVEVSQPKRPAPWSGYDKLVDSEQIVELTIATESDPAEVLAYESENQAREEVLVALRDLLDAQNDGDDAPITIEA